MLRRQFIGNKIDIVDTVNEVINLERKPITVIIFSSHLPDSVHKSTPSLTGVAG